MSISKKMAQASANAQQSPKGRDAIVVEEGGRKVEAVIRAAGPVGASVERVRVTADEMDAQGARRACEHVERDVRYLMEPLRVLEADVEAGVTQARSSQPACDDSGRHYYELTGAAGQLDLQRYCKPDDKPRESEPMDLTHQQLGRLAEDLHRAAESS